MDKQVSFFGFNFTILTFSLLAFAWTVFLFGVCPYFLHVNGWVYVFYTVGALCVAGFVNRKILFLLVAVFFISKTVVVWFQNFMLVLSGFLATLIYWFFVHMSFRKFMVQFAIITFSIFVYYTLLIKVFRMSEED